MEVPNEKMRMAVWTTKSDLTLALWWETILKQSNHSQTSKHTSNRSSKARNSWPISRRRQDFFLQGARIFHTTVIIAISCPVIDRVISKYYCCASGRGRAILWVWIVKSMHVEISLSDARGLQHFEIQYLGRQSMLLHVT